MSLYQSSSSALLKLKRLYGGTLPLRTRSALADWDIDVHLPEPSFQQEIIQKILLSDHFLMFPPSTERRRMFWKWVIQRLENGGEEIDERIYNAYVALLPKSSTLMGPILPSPSYITRFWRGNANFDEQPYLTTLLESQTIIESGTTGLRTWNASLALADWLITHPETVQSRNILELGSGAGFLGLIIARLQLNHLHRDSSSHPSLTLSDVNSDVLERCRQNFLLPCSKSILFIILHLFSEALDNVCHHPNLQFVFLDWSDAQDQSSLSDPHFSLNQHLGKAEVMIGADLVYDLALVPSLAAVLKQFFRLKVKTRDIFALFALTIRRQETVDAFLQCLATNSLIYEELDATHHASEFAQDMDIDEWRLYRIQCSQHVLV